MAVPGGFPDPGAQDITTGNPNGGVHGAPQPAWMGVTRNPQDAVITTNANGAHTSVNRPVA